MAQLRETSEITKYVSPKDYERKAEQIKNLRQDLDKYSAELHKELNCGFTVYQLINLFESCKNAEDIEFTDCDNIAKEGTRQSERDKIKNAVLTKYQIPFARLPAIGNSEIEKITDLLESY